MASSEGGIDRRSPWITKPFLRSISKSKASSSSSNTDQPGSILIDQLPQMQHDHEIDIDRGSTLQQVERSYREHALKELVRRQLTSELTELGGVDGVAKLLGTDLRTGLGAVTNQEEDKQVILEQLKREVDLRRRLLGTNIYDVPASPAKGKLLRGIVKEFYLSGGSIAGDLSWVCIILLIILGFVAHGSDENINRAYGPALLVIQFILDVIYIASAYRCSQLSYVQVSIRKKVQVVKAIRCGRKRVVLAQDLVVGDLVELKSGDRIPGDGLMVEGHGFKIDCPVKGTPTCLHNSSFLTSGCFVHSGLGLMLVTAVGEDCKSLSSAESSCSSTIPDGGVDRLESAFLHRVWKLNVSVHRLTLSISALFICFLLPFYFCSPFRDTRPTKAISVIYDIVNSLYISLTFVTSVVPDTVELAVRLSLGSFLQRVSAQRASICNPEKCESKLGFVTTICTGKGNVLTLNEMEVHSFWIAGAQYPCYQILLTTQYINPSISSALPEDIREILSEGVALNYTTGYYANKGTDSKILEDSYESAMEKALLRWGQNILSINLDSVREKCTTTSMEFIESMRMRSGIKTQRRGSKGKCVMHWKGAAEILLSSCSSTWLRTEAGGRAELVSLADAHVEKSIKGIVSSMGENGLSCVALVYCEEAPGDSSVQGAAGSMVDGSIVPSTSTTRLPGKDVTLLALVGIKQALRPEAREAVKKAKDEGIRVIMVTGDSLAAATAIAKDCGIIEQSTEVDINDKVVHASTFEAWDAGERAKRLEKLAVLARATGLHKLQLVENLQANYGRKEVVAVTGYKLTDGPALKKADVAFFFNSGVQAANYKESSDVILSDDAGFASLYNVIQSARCMRYNIQHYIHFQVTLSFSLALTAVVSVLQWQWIHLIAVLAIIALVRQRPICSLLSHEASVPPVDERLFTYPMLRNVALQAAYQV